MWLLLVIGFVIEVIIGLFVLCGCFVVLYIVYVEIVFWFIGMVVGVFGMLISGLVGYLVILVGLIYVGCFVVLVVSCVDVKFSVGYNWLLMCV